MSARSNIETDAELVARASEGGKYPGLEAALEGSLRIGNMLLKREEEELTLVKQYADELSTNHFALPANEMPCAKEREMCTECYTTNNTEPLKCASVVSSYATCSREAQKAFVLGSQ